MQKYASNLFKNFGIRLKNATFCFWKYTPENVIMAEFTFVFWLLNTWGITLRKLFGILQRLYRFLIYQTNKLTADGIPLLVEQESRIRKCGIIKILLRIQNYMLKNAPRFLGATFFWNSPAPPQPTQPSKQTFRRVCGWQRRPYFG